MQNGGKDRFLLQHPQQANQPSLSPKPRRGLLPVLRTRRVATRGNRADPKRKKQDKNRLKQAVQHHDRQTKIARPKRAKNIIMPR